MKIIFLDIDGVLVTNWSRGNRRVGIYKIRDANDIPFDYRPVSLLNELVQLTDSKIVIISSWRDDMPTIEILQHAFIQEGVKAEIIGFTEITNYDLPRFEEIQNWFENNKDIQIESFVILDDEIDGIIDVFPNNTIKCRGLSEGFNKENFDSALRILKRKE